LPQWWERVEANDRVSAIAALISFLFRIAPISP
jgi:hypothetical protein